MSTPKNPRVVAFIDGFNLYHYINSKSSLKPYKWLDVKSLCSKFIPPSANITNVTWFSALPFWNPEKVKRHELYIKALEHVGVDIRLGKFKKVSKGVRINERTHLSYYTHEEKQTDVNLAVEMMRSTYAHEYDTLLLVSGDTDYLPVIRNIKSLFSYKTIHVVVPSTLIPRELDDVADRTTSISKKHLKSSMLPPTIKLSSGRTISAPKTWK